MRPLSAVKPFAAAPPRYGEPMRVVAWVIGIVLVLGVGYAGPPRLILYGKQPTLTVTPVAAPAVGTNGQLTWLGGARLEGSDRAFGGFSALAARAGPAGTRLLLLSDGGSVTRFTLDSSWRPHAAHFTDLPGGPRTGWEKRDRDSESLTLDARGRAWVGFESVNGIWRFAPGLARSERAVRPRAMKRWAANGGPEALVRLADGRFLVLGETARWPGRVRRLGRAAIVFRGDPTVRPNDGFGFVYRPAPGFDPVDAAQLPDGDLLVLERQWLLPVRFRSRLVRVALAALKPGAVVTGTEVGRIAPPFPTENYEGVAVTREGPATIVWLVSDDDQSWYRRAYLLKFRLETTAARRSPKSDGPRQPNRH